MKKYFFLIYCIVFVLLLYNCAPHTSYKIKSFFFDGVPNPFTYVADDTILVAENTIDSSLVNLEGLTPKKEIVIKGSIHKPYSENKCESCHNPAKARSLNTTTASNSVLCFDCHKNFNEKYTFNHGPSAIGLCKACHDAHKSDYKNLTTREGQDLCLFCHQKEDVLANKFHSKIEDKSCTLCHNPHGGDNAVLMNKRSCTQCHNNVVDSNQFVHGPVASGECYTCHTTHDNKTKYKLIRTDSNLCYNCHLKKDIDTPIYHRNSKIKDCKECHNPHGGNVKYFLKINN